MRACAAALATALLAGAVAASGPWRWQEDERATLDRLEQSVKTKNDRFRLETEHWRIETELSPRFTAEVGLFMERFLDEFTGLLRSRSLVSLRPTVVVHRSQRRYQERTKARDWQRGHFSYRYDESGAFTMLEIHTYVDDGSDDFAYFDHHVLQHEGTHLLLQKYLGPVRVPSWFNEGLATRFERWNLRLGAAENEKACHEATARYVVGNGTFRPVLPIESILAIDREVEHDHGAPMTAFNYATSAAFIDFLLASGEREQLLVEVFQRISRGVESRNLLTAEEIHALTPAWQEYWFALHRQAMDHKQNRE